MQPVIVAEQISHGVAAHLVTTFPDTMPGFDGLINRFLAKPGNLSNGR